MRKKLTEQDVYDIKFQLANTHMKPREIADVYDVSPQLIYAIKSERVWKNVPWPIFPARSNVYRWRYK